MDIEDIIEEKYTNWLNCETDDIDLTIEEAKHILVNDNKQRYVDDLLEEAWKVVLSELEKKDSIINLMALAILNYDDQLVINKYKDINEVKETFEEYLKDNANDVKEYFTNKVEREGK